MALQLKNRVRATSTTTGTGTYTLGPAPTGFQGFDQIPSGRQVHYCAEDGTDWEVGVGTVTVGGSTTLSRDTVLESSNAGGPVSWAAGTRNIFITSIAQALEAISYESGKRKGDFSGTVKVTEALVAQAGVNAAGSVGGSADAITATLTPAITAYGDLMPVTFIPAANNTGAATLSLNGLADKSIKKLADQALVAGDLVDNHPAYLIFDFTGDRWILLNPQAAAIRAPTFSTSAPSGGADGDIWFQYIA